MLFLEHYQVSKTLASMREGISQKFPSPNLALFYRDSDAVIERFLSVDHIEQI